MSPVRGSCGSGKYMIADPKPMAPFQHTGYPPNECFKRIIPRLAQETERRLSVIVKPSEQKGWVKHKVINQHSSVGDGLALAHASVNLLAEAVQTQKGLVTNLHRQKTGTKEKPAPRIWTDGFFCQEVEMAGIEPASETTT